MIRKAIFLAGTVMLVGLLFFGRDAASYVRTSVGYLRESVRDSIPPEMQIDRARQMIEDLTPEIRQNMHVIAKEEVEVERLEERITQTEARLEKEKADMLRLKTDLAEEKETYKYGNRAYTSDQVKTDLANRFERYKTGEATLDSMRQLYAARQRSVEAARQKLEGMLASRRQLEVDVENLEAQRQMVAAAQTTSSYSFDESRLGRVKELVSDLRTRLDTEMKLVDAQQQFRDEIPLDKPTPDSIINEVSEYFSSSADAENVGKVAAVGK